MMQQSDTPRTDAEAMDGQFYDDLGSRTTLHIWDYKKDKDGEVVPVEFARELERENERLQDELSDWIQIAQRRANKLADMREVLEWLVDLQNGCPLPKYEKDWERTMQQALVLLGRSNDGTQRRLPPPLSNDNTQNENGGSRSLE